MIFSRVLASPGFLLFAEIPMLEPPAKTGAGLPSLPGSGKTPKTLSSKVRVTFPVAASVPLVPIDQCAHPGAMMVAAESETGVAASEAVAPGIASSSLR